ncbi:MAG: SgcJ/EcaC family oxidoreductase [Planctomycetes bacterium]|nr:SgcJ/EcaC family oxidoreductase [Planctomycetota bacterium]
MRFRRFFGLGLGLAIILAISQVVAPGMKHGNAQEQKVKAAPKLGEGKRAQDFIAAFNKGDAKATAAFWAPEATYVDQSGHETKGRAAIEKLYEKVFAGKKGAKLNIHVISARLLSPDVGLEEGITEVTPADGNPSTVARFSAILVKKDGEWYFESVRDSVARPPTNVAHFEDIEWLIGDWVGESEKGESGRASYAWAENQNFIVSSFATTHNGIPVFGGTQWIGWDAVDKQIKSWSFYSGGGHGQAGWKKNGDKWLLTTTARTVDGRTVTGVNVLTKVDADHTIWQLTKLTVDGEAKPDPQPLKLKRVKPAQ